MNIKVVEIPAFVLLKYKGSGGAVEVRRETIYSFPDIVMYAKGLLIILFCRVPAATPPSQ